MTPRLGLTFVPTLPPERLRAIALACDRHLDELWLWEDCFKESGIASAAAALAWTERLGVGLGLMPVPLRNVALTAMEVATVHRMFPGRFHPGVGHGVQEWMGQVGARVGSPLALLEEYAVALRRLLDGEEVTVRGRYVRLDRVRLDWPPVPGTPLWLGGIGPRTLELSGRLGDGVLLGPGASATRRPPPPGRPRRAAGPGPTSPARRCRSCTSSSPRPVRTPRPGSRRSWAGGASRRSRGRPSADHRGPSPRPSTGSPGRA